jgi:predicted Zn-dependent peptidase
MDGKPLTEEYAEELLLSTVRSILTTPPTPEEMERAKAYVIGRFLVDHESQAMRAFYPAYYELMGLGYDYDAHFPNMVDTVTEKDVMSLAKSVLAKDWVSVVEPENDTVSKAK